MLNWLRLRLRGVVRHGALQQEMHDEMREHIERATERLMRRGMTEPEARAEARREFGNATVIEEDAREARRASWLDALRGDLRFAARHFARRPLASVTIVLVLALGIGVNSALFSMIQAVTLRPAPGMPDDRDLVRIRGVRWSEDQSRRFPRPLSFPELLQLAERRETFGRVAGWATDEVMLRVGTEQPRSAPVQFVTPNFFATTAVATHGGPGLRAGTLQDVGDAEMAAIISHRLWQEEFGGGAITGTTIDVNGVSLRIAGIAPEKFHGATPASGRPAALWIPISARGAILRGTSQALASADSGIFSAIARVAPGVAYAQAEAVAAGIAKQFAESRGSRAEGGTAEGEAASRGRETSEVIRLRGETELRADTEMPVVIAVFGTVCLLVLLVTCTNVSALMVGAAVARRREIAVRLSLGASRMRLVRQLLTESTLLAVSGGLAGLLLYWWIVTILAKQMPAVEMAPDLLTVGFTMIFAIGTGLLFGLSPALHATRAGVASALKDAGSGSRSRSRLQRGFVIAQIVFTQPLLVVLAMMLGATVGEGERFPAESVGERIIALRFNLWSGYVVITNPTGPSEKEKLAASMKERIAQLPGVERVVHEPTATRIVRVSVVPEDRGNGERAGEAMRVHVEGTSPGYFGMLEIPIVRGRELTAEDTLATNEAIVIDSDMARELFGSVDPVGKRMTGVFDQSGRPEKGMYEVVGVFDAAYPTTRGTTGRIYSARAMKAPDQFLVRTTGPAAAFVPTLNKFLRAEAPELPIGRLETLAEVGRAMERDAMQITAGSAAAGLLALLLASMGLYGVVALAVGQRTREIGVRVAIGAKPGQVVRMFFASGLRLSAVALLIGLPISIAAVYFANIQVVGPQLDLKVVALAVGVAVLIVASLATWIPARRAAAVDPLTALRAD